MVRPPCLCIEEGSVVDHGCKMFSPTAQQGQAGACGSMAVGMLRVPALNRKRKLARRLLLVLLAGRPSCSKSPARTITSLSGWTGAASARFTSSTVKAAIFFSRSAIVFEASGPGVVNSLSIAASVMSRPRLDAAAPRGTPFWASFDLGGLDALLEELRDLLDGPLVHLVDVLRVADGVDEEQAVLVLRS